MSRDDDRVAIYGYTVPDGGSGSTSGNGRSALSMDNFKPYRRADLRGEARSASLDLRIDG